MNCDLSTSLRSGVHVNETSTCAGLTKELVLQIPFKFKSSSALFAARLAIDTSKTVYCPRGKTVPDVLKIIPDPDILSEQL